VCQSTKIDKGAKKVMMPWRIWTCSLSITTYCISNKPTTNQQSVYWVQYLGSSDDIIDNKQLNTRPATAAYLTEPQPSRHSTALLRTLQFYIFSTADRQSYSQSTTNIWIPDVPDPKTVQTGSTRTVYFPFEVGNLDEELRVLCLCCSSPLASSLPSF